MCQYFSFYPTCYLNLYFTIYGQSEIISSIHSSSSYPLFYDFLQCGKLVLLSNLFHKYYKLNSIVLFIFVS